LTPFQKADLTPFQTIRLGTVRAFGGVSPPWCSRLVPPAATVPSADFFHAVGAGCPALSHFLPHAASRGAWKISRGKHMSFSTWMPSIRAELIMDRGLYLVLQARPTHARLTRFLFVTPYFRGTLPQRSHCLPRHRHRIPRCDNTMPFASIWLGLRLAKVTTTW